MTGIATVKSLLPNGNAVIEVASSNVCSSDCVDCYCCFDTDKTFTAVALNQLNALPGDRVKVETPEGTVIKSAVLLYVIPLLMLIFVYCVLPFGEIIKIIGAVAGLFISFLIIITFRHRIPIPDSEVLRFLDTPYYESLKCLF